MCNREWATYLSVLRGRVTEKGGPGSGHWGHKGRKGKRGGSTRSGRAGIALDSSFAKSSVGKTLEALSEDYSFTVMGSAGLRLHLGEDMKRMPKDLDVLDLSQKRMLPESREDRWVGLTDPRMGRPTELQDMRTGVVIQHYESGQMMDTVRGIRAPYAAGTGTEKVRGMDVLPLKTIIELKSQAGRNVDEKDVMNAIKAKNLPREYLGRNIDYYILWEEVHGIL